MAKKKKIKNTAPLEPEDQGSGVKKGREGGREGAFSKKKKKKSISSILIRNTP